ncbi:MAG: hypothetical protein ABI051_10960 [Vicinamibacterales bacterium]
MVRRLVRAFGRAGAAIIFASTAVSAHSGPPFPVVSNRIAGPYDISVWADPDSTDDGAPGGRFWLTIQIAQSAGTLPTATRATVSIRPADTAGPVGTAEAQPVAHDVGQQFAALVMDHEGRFAVHVAVEGPLGSAQVDTEVDATYDSRPAPALMVVFLAPFLLIGFLWVKLLLRRRRAT